jgi:hypothetical protein
MEHRPCATHISGDTVETKGVDAGGVDENGARRAAGGNPLSGLVVHLKRVRLNRNTAGSGTEIVGSALSPGYLRNLKMEEQFPARGHSMASTAWRAPPTPPST